MSYASGKAALKNLPIGVSCGEVAGIGPEVIMKSWLMRRESNLPVFILYGNQFIFEKIASDLGLKINFKSCSPEDAADIFDNYLPIYEIDAPHHFIYGVPNIETAPLVINSIDQIVRAIFDQRLKALVTAPIQKSVLYDLGFKGAGHTEYLAKLCSAHAGEKITPIMLLAADELRVIPMTIHVALSKVPALITEELIFKTALKTNEILKSDFNISSPRIAFAGLNPHAGEEGTMGNEEIQIIIPALNKLRDKGLNILGPLSADTMFYKSARAKYDIAICMYHDQALIPLKTIDFDGGINITAGLPIVRCSPDHGTALDIAGQGIAKPTSFIKSLLAAERIADHRLESLENGNLKSKNLPNV